MASRDAAPALDQRAGAAHKPHVAGTLTDAAHIVNALGVAYGTFQLFQAADAQPAFRNAIEVLRDAPAIDALEVAGDHFIWARNPVQSAHPGVGRLAGQLFGHGIAAIRFFSPPSAADVIAVFDVIRRHPEDQSLVGGASRALLRQGVGAIRIVDRAPLTESDPIDEAEDPENVWGAQNLIDPADYTGNPESFAHRLLTHSGHDPGTLVGIVIEMYSDALGLIDDDDVWGREELVHTFVDAFFYLTRGYQGPLLAELLARRDVPEFQMLLDQFAHHELHELAPYLDRESHPLLVEYAQMTFDDDQLLDDLHTLIQETAPARQPEVPITSRIARVLRSSSTGAAPPARQALYRLREQIADVGPASGVSAGVMLGLLELARTPSEATRRLSIWARKLMRTIQAGGTAEVVEWASMVLENPSLDLEPSDVDDAVIKAADGASVRALVRLDAGESGHEPVIERLYPCLTAPMIEVLGEELDAGRRRILLRLLTHAARIDPAPIVDALDDPRWYVVRNLVLVLGHSTHAEVAEAVRPLLSHPDPRVRREVIRALHALEGDKRLDCYLAALEDDDHSVRTVAATAIRTSESPDVVPTLVRIVEGPASADVKGNAVELLGSLESSTATKALERLASRRLWPTRNARSLRIAARRALESRR